MTENSTISDDDLNILSTIVGKRAFLTCTSGTTGKPKIIVHTHKTALWRAFAQRMANLVSHTDIVVTWASSLFVLHPVEMSYTWPNGASLVVLKEGGNMDVDYLTRSIKRYQATYLLTSPIVLPMLTNLFRRLLDTAQRLNTLRILSTAGKCFLILYV